MASVRAGGAILIVASAIGCAHRVPPAPAHLAVVPAVVAATNASNADSYIPVPAQAAVILGCSAPGMAPVCEVAPPNADEDSAFTAEAERLAAHPDQRCRDLASAIAANRSRVMMYRKAIVRYSGPVRKYGVGHTYAMDDEWLVRVARRIDDLNERTLDEKTRTLRHEMSHTLGASEEPAGSWTAEDYADRC